MSKIIQYRCPTCKRLLIKWETGSDKVLYVDYKAQWIKVEGQKAQDIICSKCKTRCEVCSDGLRKIDSDTPGIPELAKHIVGEPVLGSPQRRR